MIGSFHVDRNSKGVVKDVLIKVKDFVFPVDFVIIDIEEDVYFPLILGHLFLSTSRALINMEKEMLLMRIGGMKFFSNSH